MANPDFDSKAFRQALGKFPTGVTVITSLDEQDSPVGVTASSFNSVSMDPPLVLWSIDKSARSESAFSNATHFAVNVLCEAQVETSNRFASRGEDKFSGIDYETNEQGVPMLAGCAARFECKTWAVYDGGDHNIIVGEILEFEQSSDLKPLVFSEGSYAVTGAHPGLD